MPLVNARGQRLLPVQNPTGQVLADSGQMVSTGGGGPHTHQESEVVGLTSTLAGKASASHVHPDLCSGTDSRLSDARQPAAHEHSGYCGASDSRLSDARTPLTHGHGQSDVSGLADALAGKCGDTDPRLADARTPTAHAHAPGDVTGTAVVTADSRLSDARTPTAHSHAASDVTGTAVLTADARLSDARTPTAHNQDASTINAGTLDGDRLPALSTGKKGGCPATGSPSGKYLRDDGTWETPPGGSGGNGYVLNGGAANQATTTDSQTMYWGSLPSLAPTTTAGNTRIYIPKAGTIRAAQVFVHAATAGSAEAWVMNIRLNNTSDTQIASLASAAAQRLWAKYDLAITVAAGDYIEIKEVQPAWGTNPANVRRACAIYIE